MLIVTPLILLAAYMLSHNKLPLTSITLLGAVLIAGLTITGATELSAKSKLFAGLRHRILITGALAGARGRWLVAGLADGFLCPYCVSHWHGVWAVALTIWLMGLNWTSGLLIYLPSVVVAKIIHDRWLRSSSHLSPRGELK